MNQIDFDAALALVRDGDSFSVRVGPNAPPSIGAFLGRSIESMSGDWTHIGLVYNRAGDKSIEAAPPHVDFAKLSAYRGQPGISIAFYRLKAQTPIQTQQILNEALNWIGVPYNLAIIGAQAARATLCGLPIIGGLLFSWWLPTVPVWGGWDNAALKKSGVDCSCLTSIIMRSALPTFLKKYKDPRAITPTEYADAGELVEISRAMD